MNNLAFFGGPKTISEADAKFVWPVIDGDVEKAVLEQLRDTISIYDRSSVFRRFEDEFKDYHGRRYGLVSNSGTSSIHAMFDAVGLLPGDEVLCPVYTFHAAVSPMMSLGAIPIFCDCDQFGNISFDEVRKKITDRSKVVIVTHMWGVPCLDIEEIANFCKEKGLWLLEDCSHAHGATIDGRMVGTFGDMAAWSLQGQKIVTGGEGGILLTDSLELYQKALLHGHYNKRPKQEIEKDSNLAKFFLTGKGLKLRAHPLAIAIALNQFRRLPGFRQNKNLVAEKFDEMVDEFNFVSRPLDGRCENSWYAFIFKYDSYRAGGVSREDFVELLLAEGLVEFDIPGSTGLLNDLPLFISPQEVYPGLYSSSLVRQSDFPLATAFVSSLIKLPVWSHINDLDVVRAYTEGFRKVANFIASRPDASILIKRKKGVL